DQIEQSLKAANAVAQAGARVTGDRSIPLTAGTAFADADEISRCVIGMNHGQAVFFADVATIRRGADHPVRCVWDGAPPGRGGPEPGQAPAVTLAVTKLSGTNAADITTRIRQRVQALEGMVIPDGVRVAVTRDYGETSTAKANLLIQKLI